MNGKHFGPTKLILNVLIFSALIWICGGCTSSVIRPNSAERTAPGQARAPANIQTNGIITSSTPSEIANTNIPQEVRATVLEVYRDDNGLRAHDVHRGQTISFVVTNLDAWLRSPDVTNTLTKDMPALPSSLIPYINDFPMKGSQFKITVVDKANNWSEVQFALMCNADDPDSKTAWKNLISSIPLTKMVSPYPVTVSLGVPDGEIMNSDVGPDGSEHFSFVVIPHDLWTAAGFAAIVVSLAIFAVLAANTNIIRDPSCPRRPDGNAVFSLARTQMAFWFFLVLSSYFFLWVITGDRATIPDSVVILMGISAGTAVGSAFVDAGKTNEQGRTKYLWTPKPNQTTAQIIAELVGRQQHYEEQLAELRNGLDTIPAEKIVLREQNQNQQKVVADQIDRTEVQLAFYRSSPLKRFQDDVLGDDGQLSFHRFQIAAWTLVLGIIFVQGVITTVAMPEFNSTVLGLMGISSGTYIGFKIPGGKN